MSSNYGYQKGISLLEVLVASTIMATVAVLSFGALHVTDRSREVSEERLASIQQLDRMWLMVEADLRNALGYTSRTSRGETIPAFIISGEEYWLNLLRGGKSNPLLQFRTELQRVAYRLDDEDALWRDSWYDPGNVSEESARKQKLMEGIASVKILVLPPNVNSLQESAWVEEWPGVQAQDLLPIAVKVTIEIEGRGKLERMFLMQPGK